MASTAGIGYSDVLNNFLGEYFLSGVSDTPFLAAIGAGVSDDLGGIAPVNLDNSNRFAMSQTSSLDTPTQDVVSEQSSVGSGTSRFYNRSQNTNVVEFHRRKVTISDVKKSKLTAISGIAIADPMQPIRDEVRQQSLLHMAQLRRNFNFSALGGTLSVPGDSSAAGQTQGILTGVLTHRTDLAGGTTLNQSHVDDLIADMWDDGVDLSNSVFVCDLRTAQALRDIYGVAPESRTIGGVNLQQIVTQGGFTFGILTDPIINNIQSADSNKKYLGLVNLSLCRVVGLVNPEAGSAIYMKRTAEDGFGENREIFAALGIDFSSQDRHGLIYDFNL